MNISAITVDPSIQARESLDSSRLEQFIDILKDGNDLAPISVYFDGEVHWLADGFHRYESYLQVGRSEIPAKIHQGTFRDAVLCGIRSNAHHGIGLKLNERRNAAWRLLLDSEWCQWNDKYIARICGLDHDTVKKIRFVIASEVADVPNPKLLRTLSIRNRIDNSEVENLQSSACNDSNQLTSTQNPQLLRIVSIRNRIDSPDPNFLEVISVFPEPDSDSNIRMVLRGNTKYPMKTGNIGKKGKTKKPTYEPLPNIIDITAHSVHEKSPPSRSNPPGVFTVHNVQFEEPLIADSQLEFTFKVLTSGPSFAMPLIFQTMEAYPLYAQHVLNEALKISAKTNGIS